jgi:hypothetical protein
MRYAPLLLLLALPVRADLIKPEARCGPPISRDSVQTLDISELPPEAGEAEVRRRFGPVAVVRSKTVQARTAFGRAWKRAEQEAADLGCPFVVLLGRERVTTGGSIIGTAILPAKRDSVSVLYAKPAEPSADPQH